ncbi:MAG: multidrug effflux MFS transporter [Pigmentiphaga sp.]|nr:multidrug effflux MFS transporter [Pigmentiphaga sp.]
MTTRPSASPVRMPPLWMLVLISLSGTLAIHIYVPALPIAGRELGASMALMQSTISLYIIGLAVGQLIYGPLADGFGRRPVLLVGLSVFLLASVAAAFAPNAESLIAARLLQALGGCSGLVLGRVIVRDTSVTHDTVRRLALINLMTTMAPACAPLLGAALAAAMGWRSIFIVLAGLGAVNLWLTWRRLEETGSPSREVRVSGLMRDYRRMLSSGRFVALAVGGSFATMSIYAVMVAAPFIFTEELHRSTTEMGFFIMLMMFGMTLGNAITSRLVGKVRLSTLLIRGNLLSLVAALLFVALVLTGHLNLIATIVLFACMTLAVGFCGPGAVTKAISVDPARTGTASGLYGAAQMLVGAIATVGAGLGPSPALAAGLVMLIAGLISQGCLRWAIALEAPPAS